MNKNLPVIAVLVSAMVIAGCESSKSKKSKKSPDATQSVLYTVNTTGGSHGVGAWTILDKQSINQLKTVDETEGFISPDPEEMEKAGRSGSSIGMVFNPVDGYFYGILPDAGFVLLKNTDESTSRDKLIRFEPNTDKLEYLTDMPLLLAAGEPEPYGEFYTAPVVSPDGKSLMMVSQKGGKTTPGSSGGTGGLFHVNIDATSPDYLKASLVYSFSSFTHSVDPLEQLNDIESVPLLNRVNGKYEIFLMANSSSITQGIRKGRAFALSPTNSSDWSQGWNLEGESSTWTEYGRTVRQPYFDRSLKHYVWLVAPDNGTSPGSFYVRNTNVNPIETTAKADTIPAILLGDGTSGGRGLPLAVWGRPSNSLYHYMTQGVPGKQVNIDALGYARIVEVSSTYVDRYIFPSTMLSSTSPDKDQLFPAGLALSPETGYMYLHSRTDQNTENFQSKISLERNGKVSTDDYFKRSLSDLYTQYGMRPSQIDRFNYANFGFRTALFSGTVDDGYIFAGVPAVGNDADGNVARYLVTYAMHGAKHGEGAIIKYDLLDLSYTSTPFGISSPGLPEGKSIQLDSGKVLGSTLSSVGAGLKPQLVNRGVWVQDLKTGATEEFAMPLKDASYSGAPAAMVENVSLVNFAKAENGSVWGVSMYRTFDAFAIFTGEFFKPALTQFDKSTGQPIDTYFLDDDFIGLQNIYGMSVRGNVLSFINNDKVWFVDVSNPAALKKQSIVLDDTGNWDAPFAPVMQAGADNLFFMTLKNGGSNEVNIHKVVLDDALLASPTISVVANNLPDAPSTPMFEASDGNMYYGTINANNAKMMRFDPSDNSVTEVADLSEPGKTSYANGFLSEPREGVLMGVLVDSTSEELGSGLRGYAVDINTDTVLQTFDASSYLSIEDEFPGFLSIKY